MKTVWQQYVEQFALTSENHVTARVNRVKQSD